MIKRLALAGGGRPPHCGLYVVVAAHDESGASSSSPAPAPLSSRTNFFEISMEQF